MTDSPPISHLQRTIDATERLCGVVAAACILGFAGCAAPKSSSRAETTMPTQSVRRAEPGPQPGPEPQGPRVTVDPLRPLTSVDHPCRMIEAPQSLNGGAPEVPRVTTYVYDDAGRLAFEDWGYPDEAPRIAGIDYVTERGINIELRTTYFYDDAGRVDYAEREVGAWGVVNEVERSRYDERGREIRYSVEDAKSGTEQFVITRQWDSEDRILREETDSDGDGAPEEVLQTEYPAQGRKVTTLWRNGTKAFTSLKVQKSSTLTVSEMGDITTRDESELDSEGRLVGVTSRTQAPSFSQTSRTDYEYDAAGRLVRRLLDGGTGRVTHITEWSYECGEPTVAQGLSGFTETANDSHNIWAGELAP